MSPASVTKGAVFQGRYQILSLLREGGFAVVYEATQLATGQPVAIKVLHPIVGATPAEVSRRRARFLREMRFSARLHHPNIVRLIDSGESDEGRLYTVFEFVPGKNLAEVLAGEGALEPQEARHLMLQVLDALGCAHGQGVIHRDLKPANVMIVPTGARRNALVVDFGISAVAGGAPEDVKLTGSNEILCTPAYAAPEQLRGLAPTARSDLYAWGLVFLECLTGRSVVSGGSMQEVLVQQVSPEPIRIPAALARHPLGALLRRATIKDFTARAVAAEGLLRELEGCEVGDLRRGDLAEPGRDPTGEGPWSAGSASAPREEPAPIAPARGGEPREAADLLEGERRPLTVVCCAVTAQGPGLGPMDVEEIDEILEEVQETCAAAARRHHGHFAGALGDRVMLHFGCPAAIESDARHAVRAALALVAQIRARSARLSAERDVSLDVRAGVHTGLVVAPGGEESLMDLRMTPQVAARLVGLAPPGAVLISRDTYGIVRGELACEEIDARLDIGVPRVVTVYRATEDLTPSIAPRAYAEKSPTAPIFGRDLEIDLLLQRWTQARSGSGQVVLVTGGLGIGKTRLVFELARRLQGEAHTYLECRCVPERRLAALHPAIELLERLLEPPSGATEDGRIERLEALVRRRGGSPAEMVPLLGALLSIPLPPRYEPVTEPPQRQKERTLGFLLSLVVDAAEETPVLFVVEDLQWADPTTLEWLGALADEAGSSPVLAVLTAQPAFSPPWPTSGMQQIQLGRLDRPHIERLIGRITRGKALPGGVLDKMVGLAEGVPLFAEELTRAAIESGVVREERERYVLAEPIAELVIPTTLRALSTVRLDRLGRAKETAQLAAALGREFRHDVLAAVCALDEATLQEDLDRLLAGDLIRRRRRARTPTYMFKHALVRDAVYETMSKGARRRVNARIARTLEEQFPQIVESNPDVLALHHAAAEQKSEAIEYAERAARRALDRPVSGADEAAAHITRPR